MIKNTTTKVYPEQSRRVLVAMSGGVDSSVAAALLKKAGFEVAGAFMKCWDGKNRFGECTAIEDATIARQAAKVINIPFYTFDFTKEYRREVFDYFISEYKAGRTPNPDVMCNKTIKFGMFLKKALAMGFDYVAAGHYIKIRNSKCKMQNDKSKFKIVYKLLRAKDRNKDQSYFLWQLIQKQLRYCLFPIGDYTKDEVREMARKFGLPNAERKDSQGLCFVGKVKLADFLEPYIPVKKGKIVDTKGNFLGWHRGVATFTIGQRQGIGLAGGPYFVVDKDIKKNILMVSRDEKDLYKKEVLVGDVNWISGKAPSLPMRVQVAIRYRQKPESAVLTRSNVTGHDPVALLVSFGRPQRAIAPGQSAVFYKGQELLGGGIIVKSV